MTHPVVERLYDMLDGLPSGSTVRAEVEKFVIVEEEKHLAELFEFAKAHVTDFLTQEATRELSRRRHRAHRSVFRDVAEEAASLPGATPGSVAEACNRLLDDLLVVAEGNVRKRLAEMTAQDCLFVAEGYEQRSKSAELEALFWRAVAKKAGRRLVGDVFTEESLASMRRSIVG